MEKIIITTNNTSKIKERAAMLAKSIKNVKIQGIEVFPHEPIEGKMFWSKSE
jgi:inosine/xanthosine triphosphate pyrophosphatase family protein